MDKPQDITRLIHAAADGDKASTEALYDSVYTELREIAKQQRRKWQGNQTIDTVALLHEAYLKLAPSGHENFSDRAHFFATAATAMRQILINYAERSRRQKRGGDAIRITLTESAAISGDTAEELLQIDTTLSALRDDNARAARVFECKVFGGMTLDEISAALNISVATVKRDWRFASSWVYTKLST